MENGDCKTVNLSSSSGFFVIGYVLENRLKDIKMDFLKEHFEQLDFVLNKYGKENQVMIAVEEMAELSKELLKNINRDKNNEKEIIEEVADVYILLEQVKKIYNISENQLLHIAEEKYYRWKKQL